jgi:hypothetical protein
MAETLLANGPSQRSAGDRHQVVVHVERDDIAGDSRDGCCELEDGPALPAETARRGSAEPEAAQAKVLT